MNTIHLIYFKAMILLLFKCIYMFKFSVTGTISYWLLAEIVPCSVKGYIGYSIILVNLIMSRCVLCHEYYCSMFR